MAKKTIYLHIGMPKTGTSSIQMFLYKNREKLEKEGFLYPVVYPFLDIAPIRGGNVVELFYSITDKLNLKTPCEIVEEFNNKFLPVIKNSKADKIVFSSEGIFLSPFDYFESFFELDYDFKVIVYIRKPTELLITGYSQTTKQGIYLPSAEEFIENYIINYSVIKDYIKHLGKENVIVRPYEKEQWRDGNLIKDFLECIGYEYKDAEIGKDIYNTTLSRDKTEIIRLKNALGFAKSISTDYSERFIHSGNIMEHPKIIETIADDVIKTSTEKWIPIIDEIAQIYGKKKMFLNDYPECYGKKRPKFDRAVFSLEELDILHEAILKAKKMQEDEVAELKSEIERLKTELKQCKFCTSWEHNNHKIYKIGKLRIKFRKK